jgi:hypothetical protein
MYIPAILLTIPMIFLGCSHTLVLTKDSTESDFRAAEAHLEQGRNISYATLVDYSHVHGYNISISNHLVDFYNPDGSLKISVPTMQIERILNPKTGAAAPAGMVAGGLVGAGLGLIIGVLSSETRCSDCPREDKSPVLYGLVGAGTGAVILGSIGGLLSIPFSPTYKVVFHPSLRQP